MNSITKIISAVIIVFSTSVIADGDMGTPDEAKAMSEKAAEVVNSQGNDAFATFSDEGGEFLTKDLYVFCMDLEGTMLSHAKKPDLVGKNLIDFDKYGDKLFVKMIEVANSDSGQGWVDYKWPHPNSEEITDKTSYVIKNDQEFFCGVGAYKA